MDENGIKAKLRRLSYQKNEMQMILEQIKEIRLQEKSLRECQAVNITGMPKAKTPADVTSAKVSKIIDEYEVKINELLPALQKKQFEVRTFENIINKLEPDEKEVITSRYFKKFTWERIAAETNRARATVFRLHRKAIKSILEKWNENQLKG